MKTLHGSSELRLPPTACTSRLPVSSVLDISRLLNWPITYTQFSQLISCVRRSLGLETPAHLLNEHPKKTPGGQEVKET